jgi:hypothetical protein
VFFCRQIGHSVNRASLISNLMPEIPPPRKLRLVGPREELIRLCDHAEYRCLREAQLWSSWFSLADLSDSRKSRSIAEDDGSRLVGEHMISTRWGGSNRGRVVSRTGVVGESCEWRSLKKSRGSDSEESQTPYSKETLPRWKGLVAGPRHQKLLRAFCSKILSDANSRGRCRESVSPI